MYLDVIVDNVELLDKFANVNFENITQENKKMIDDFLADRFDFDLAFNGYGMVTDIYKDSIEGNDEYHIVVEAGYNVFGYDIITEIGHSFITNDLPEIYNISELACEYSANPNIQL